MERVIAQEEWQNYFDFISRLMQGKEVEVEAVGLDIGDQIEEEWTAFEGLSFDPTAESIYVHTYDLDHQILQPVSVTESEEAGFILAIQVIDGANRKQIIKLRDPTMIGDGHEQDDLHSEDRPIP